MATWADLARAAATAGSEPESNCTFAPGALARIDFNGDVGNHTWACQYVLPLPGGMIALPPGGSTWAEPPPEIIPTSAWAPITAMLATLETSSGSCECSFLSS